METQTLDICAMDPFAEVLDAEADITITAADFEDAFRQLPQLLSAYSDGRKLHARGLLKIPVSVNQPTDSAPDLGEILEEKASSSSNFSPVDTLDLATAVFICKEAPCFSSSSSEPYLFGWDDIAQHHCKPDLDSVSNANNPSYGIRQHVEYVYIPQKILFTAQGSKIAAAVVRAAGLDDRITKASDMDEKDLRFGCSACPLINRNIAAWTKAGYKWRDFVRSTFFFPFPPGSLLGLTLQQSQLTHPTGCPRSLSR